MVTSMHQIHGLDRRALDRARISRDPRFDGRFFIAVTSTGIYCRPICPSPTSKSANVIYYPTAAAAAEAGFRPCLRCRPEAAPGTPAWLGTSAVVRRALRLIHEGALDDASVEDLASRVGVGPRHLHRLFVRHVGASPIAVAQTRRLHFAKRLLDETHLSMTGIALAAGFGSLRRFNDAFQKTYGKSPRELRRQRGEGSPPANRDVVVLKLAYRPPYDWAQVHDFLSARAIAGLERVDVRGYARCVACEDGVATVSVQPLPHEDSLQLRVRGAVPAALFQISMAARRAFDLGADPALIAQAFRTDPLLAPLVRLRPGLRIPGAWDPFECAVRAVIGQGISVAAARTLATRLVQRLGRSTPSGACGLTHLFPSPADIASSNLDGLGLTRRRARALVALAGAVRDGGLDFGAPVEDVMAALASLPGIGDWTAQYVALRSLGEPDALPAADLALTRLAAPASVPLTPRALTARGEAWRPWRSYAVMHLWCSDAEGRAYRGGNRVRVRRPPAAYDEVLRPEG
jgi:AraC family transcriptional regulator, regulatory protein of adaptative response / DNA-3-methyladenine glycosylase II